MLILGLLITLLAIVGAMLILIILIQKGKGSMGLGALGGGAQMLFGGSGGQDLFQKTTWVLGAIFMAGSLILSIMWTRTATSGYATRPIQTQQPIQQQSMPTAPAPMPVAPESETGS